MEIIRQLNQMSSWTQRCRAAHESIGLVPTMGYLHEGHLSLCRLSIEDGGRTVVSIYVNPTQFGPGEDLERYPRNEDRDFKLLEKMGVDAVLLPSSESMYPPGYSTYVQTSGPSEGWCGASRPVHFRGVTTIVAQLFNATQPDRAYFGQKDGQQVAVIRRMTLDLKFPIEIVVGETIREADGLAMSSRNTYLSPEERRAALVLYRGLRFARKLYEEGESSADRLIASVCSEVESEPLAKLDYAGVVDRNTFRPVCAISPRDLIIGAIYVRKCRLIDNLDVSPQTYPLRTS
ncbi:MAG: pantoate--beta-alanine ligase [bacterium]